MSLRLESTKWLRKRTAEIKNDSLHYQRAALLHIYLGALTLHEIAVYAGLTIETLQGLRMNARFMKMVDTCKKEYSRDLREDLLVNNYQLDDYDSLASDVSLLDEILKMQIKVPLFTELRNLSQSIKSRTTHNLKVDLSEFMLFRRLFSFLILVEKYATTLTAQSLLEMKAIAEEIVWPGLHLDKNEIDQILNRPISTIEGRLEELRARLKGLFYTNH
ncbi:MAG: hypothetical protein AB1480_11290 [Nitrospirota bacterium]